MGFIDKIRQLVRSGVDVLAKWLNNITKGKVTPDMVTLFGAGMHVVIAVCIASDQLLLAAGLLVVFGLFDALDGSLARLQKSASSHGMLLDASTDRMKEVAIYAGVIYLFANTQPAWILATALIACGASLAVSYVKAKGEAAISTSGKRFTSSELNRLFSDGLLTFEVRMAVLVVGLISGQLVVAVIFIAILATYTAIWRLVEISKALKNDS